MNRFLSARLRVVSGSSTEKPDTGNERSALAGIEEHDNSLRGSAMRRATSGQLPKTLTPWEWEQWYKEHGYPAEFKNSRFARVKRFFKSLVDR